MEAHELESAPWFADLTNEVQEELDRIAARRPDLRPALEQEWRDLEERKRGWAQSLAKPALGAALRETIEAEFGSALDRQQEIKRQLAEVDRSRRRLDDVVTPDQVVDRLNRLAAVLAGTDPTMGNLELSAHIDAINCFQDGQVVVRTCRLGALAPAAELLADPQQGAGDPTPGPGGGIKRATPRRRARLRVDGGGGREMQAAARLAADVRRFEHLDARWFWEDSFRIPEPSFWSKEYAAEVVKLRAGGMTIEKLAKHFDKSVPTIRKALRIGAESMPGVELPRKQPRSRWAVDHAQEVLALKQQGMTTDQLVERFDKSDTTIRAAIKHASERGGTSASDHTGTV